MQSRGATQRRWIGLGLAAAIVTIGLIATNLWLWPRPIEISLKGGASGLGEQYGKKCGWRIKLLNEHYLKKVVCRDNDSMFAKRSAAASAAMANWPRDYAEELAAMASAAEMNTGMLAYANCFLDLGHSATGCRSAVISDTHGFLHAHNLDWDNLGGFARWMTCIVRRNPSDGRLRTVSVGFPGLIGTLDVINEKGVALSFNQLGHSKGSTNEPVFIMLRRIAETCTTFGEARAQILAAPAGMPFIITLSDANTATASVFERTKNEIEERPLQDGWVAACNTSQGENRRMTKLDDLLANHAVHDVGDLQKVLGHASVLMPSNLYSVIFDFRSNRMFLASGTLPAASGAYRKFDLF